MEAAVAHCTAGASVWDWASNAGDAEPDVVLACAGDIPTLETVAAAWWLRRHAPELKVRVVNVVDLMALFPRHYHPHGMDETQFVNLFTADKPVVFAFHGYQRAIHEIVHGHANTDRFHVRGFNEQGTTTTPFDMVVLNEMSRYHLASEALHRTTHIVNRAPALMAECTAAIAQAGQYAREHFADPPAISDWTWTDD
jgi:xylulose-5-phosphate/fructose-6-phosphate phosphoketolase